MQIRPIEPKDWNGTWQIMKPVIRAGQTYAYPRDMTEAAARDTWVEKPVATWVAADVDETIVGIYYIKPNQAGPGDHVCNCGYIVSEHARGRGIASKLCTHSQSEALRMGFRAMQFNLVVATNEGAVRLWKKLGFDLIGTLPEAFQHPERGYVGAHVMYKLLSPSGT